MDFYRCFSNFVPTFYGHIFWRIHFCGWFCKCCHSNGAFNKNKIKLRNDNYLQSNHNEFLYNRRTLLVCHILFSTMTFSLFKVGSHDAGKLLFSKDFSVLLITWSIPITVNANLIICDFILAYFKCLRLLCSVAQVGNYSFIFRDAG